MLKADLETLKENAVRIDEIQFIIRRTRDVQIGMAVGTPTEWTEVSLEGRYGGSSIKICSSDVRSETGRTQLGKLVLLALVSGGLKL